MSTTSYICMQVSRNLADNNTPQLCLPNAQISDFLTFWGTRDFIIAVSSQTRGQHIACVAAHVTEIPPKLAGKSFASTSSYSFYFIMELGFNLSRQFKGYVFLLQVKSAMIIFAFLLRKSRSKACYSHNRELQSKACHLHKICI